MNATLPPPGADDVLYLIDLSGYVFRAYHAISPLSSPSGEPTHATFGTVNMLMRLIDERKPVLLAVAMDSPEGSFRKELDARYKANRPAPPPDLSVQMSRCRQVVEAHRICVWQNDGFEADDIIATAVHKARAEHLKVIIVSADKDLMQLVDENVSMLDTMRTKLYGPSEVKEKYGVAPEQIRDYLSLTGDSSDNVPGVPSIGAKTAAKLLEDFGSFDGIYANLQRIDKKRTREALDQNRAEADLSRQLVTLRTDVPIDFRLETLRHGPADSEQLLGLFTELGFGRLAEAIRRARPAVEHKSAYSLVLTDEELQRVVQGCQEAGCFALDTETDSTDAMQAGLVGISLSFKAGEAYYIPLGHRALGTPKQLSLELVRERLSPLLTSDSVRKVGHNLKYDETVLRRAGFAPLRAIQIDTMLASYLLDPEATHGLKELANRELGVRMTTFDEVIAKAGSKGTTFDQVPVEEALQYAAADADLSLRLADRLLPLIDSRNLTSLLADIEIPLSQCLLRMEMTGVLVDTAYMRGLGSRLEEQLRQLEAKAKQQAGRDFNVNSPRQLETILFDELKLPVVKKTKTSRSTDASVLETLADAHPLVDTILEHRQLAKLKSTYIDALPKLIHPQTGRIHTHFNQSVAATGRLSSSDPNLQNIPIRTELGRAIRQAFIAPPGYVIVSADYSQIELRVLAHLAHDPVLIDSFQRNEDVHTRTAMEIFGLEASQVTADLRRQAKTINFGVVYGMGEVTLAKRLGIPREQASQFIEKYFERYHGVRQFFEQTLDEARKNLTVRTMLGRYRYLPDLNSSNHQLRAQAERIASNTPIQGTAADLLKLAMVQLPEPIVPGARLVLTVHDELVFEVPEAELELATERVRAVMQNVWPLDVPLVVEVGHGPNWAEAH